MLKVSVIIVNYNSGEWLKKCVNALQQSDYPFIEIVIVDNNSKDDSIKEIEQYNDIVFYKSDVNLGYSAGNNKGVELSNGDLIFILNPDAIVMNDSISKLVMAYNSLKDNRIIIAPQLLNFDGTEQISYWKFINILDIIKETFFLNYIFPSKFKLSNDDLSECEALSGASVMLSKERWKELGGFDENLFWVDDVDLCYRNIKLGGKNYLLKSAKVHHYIGGSSEKNIHKVIANQIFSRLKFFHKHNNKISTTFVVVLLLLQCISRILVYSVFLWDKKIRSKITGYYLAIKHILLWIIRNEKNIIQ